MTTKKEKAVYALKLKEGEKVWLMPFEETNQPRQQATLTEDITHPMDTTIVEVTPEDRGDDGIREILIDQIEGRVR